MEIKLTHIDNYHSKIENLNGNYIEIDNKSDLEPKGVSPMELLLMGVASKILELKSRVLGKKRNLLQFLKKFMLMSTLMVMWIQKRP